MCIVFSLLLDLDECAVNDDATICGNGKCQNIYGEYFCQCERGYQILDGQKKCVGKCFQ